MVLLKKAVKRKGELRTTVTTVKDRGYGVPKDVKTDETVEVVKSKSAKSVVMIRDVASLRLSYGYNSVMCEVGAEIPMACDPDDLVAAAKAMDRVEALVQKRMQRKAVEMKKLLRSLKKDSI